jgi:hypothetical protein
MLRTFLRHIAPTNFHVQTNGTLWKLTQRVLLDDDTRCFIHYLEVVSQLTFQSWAWSIAATPVLTQKSIVASPYIY